MTELGVARTTIRRVMADAALLRVQGERKQRVANKVLLLRWDVPLEDETRGGAQSKIEN